MTQQANQFELLKPIRSKKYLVHAAFVVARAGTVTPGFWTRVRRRAITARSLCSMKRRADTRNIRDEVTTGQVASFAACHITKAISAGIAVGEEAALDTVSGAGACIIDGLAVFTLAPRYLLADARVLLQNIQLTFHERIEQEGCVQGKDVPLLRCKGLPPRGQQRR